jgi:DNA primase
MLSLERCPDGMLGGCFFQKQKPQGMPKGTPSKGLEHVTSGGRFTEYIVGGALNTQLALVNLGCIAVHVMGSRVSSPRQPDWMCVCGYQSGVGTYRRRCSCRSARQSCPGHFEDAVLPEDLR